MSRNSQCRTFCFLYQTAVMCYEIKNFNRKLNGKFFFDAKLQSETEAKVF